MKRYDMDAFDCLEESSDGAWCHWDDVKLLIEGLELAEGCLDIERQKKQQLQKEIGYQVEP